MDAAVAVQEVGSSVEQLTLDTVEFCRPSAHTGGHHVGVLGAYELQQDGHTRRGSLALFRVPSTTTTTTHAGHHKSSGLEWLWRREDESMNGVLDFKWSGEEPTLLGAAAQSHAQLSLWKLEPGADETTDTLALGLVEEVIFDDHPHTLTLSLDWNNRVAEGQEVDPAIIASYTSGHLCVWHCTPAGLTKEHFWQAHSLEAWIAAYDQYNPSIVYSGSDDCTLKMWDLRMGTNTAIFNKRHDMGVTTVAIHPSLEHVVATGSYDETISMWDKRMMSRRPTPVAQRGTEGGGIWRIKWHPHDPSLFAVAAMHRGFFIMKWLDGSDEISTVLHHTGQHTSLAYGVDWSYHEENNLIGSCSFYDKTFSVWRPTLT